MTLFKNMALVARLNSNALSQYQQAVNNLVQTFCEDSLELNITKTKKL